MRFRIPANAIALTVFVVLTSFLLLRAPEEGDRETAFRLSLRELLVTMQAGQETQGELTPDLPATLDDLLEDAPPGDDARTAAAAMLIAFGDDDAAAAYLGQITEPTETTRLLERLRTGAVEEPSTGDEAALRGVPFVPDTVDDMLTVRYLEATGQTARASELSANLEGQRRAKLTRLGSLLGVLALSGLVGLGMWIFARRIRRRLARLTGGIRGVMAFSVTLPTVYTLFVGWFAFHLALSILMPLALVPLGLLDRDPGLAVALDSVVSGAFGLYLVQRFATPRESLLPTLGFRTTSFPGGPPHALMWGYLAYCASIPAWVLATVVNSALVPKDTVVTNPVIPMLADAQSSVGLALLAFAVAIAAPFFEEAFFRGFLYRALRDRLGVAPAVLLSAAVFAAVHLSFQTVLPLFALGCILALAYEWTGSILPSVVLHSVNNVFSMALVIMTLT